MSSLFGKLPRLTRVAAPKPTVSSLFFRFLPFPCSKCGANCSFCLSYSCPEWENLDISQVRRKAGKGFGNQRRDCPRLRYPYRRSDIVEILPSKYRPDWLDFWRTFLSSLLPDVFILFWLRSLNRIVFFDSTLDWVVLGEGNSWGR